MNIRGWLDNKRDEIDARFGEETGDVVLRKVTVRVGSSLVDKLDYVAEKTLQSRTAAAEALLVLAINEAYEATLDHPYFGKMETRVRGIDADSQQEIDELAADGELTQERLMELVSTAKRVGQETA